MRRCELPLRRWLPFFWLSRLEQINTQVELISLWSSWRGDRPALLKMRVEEVHYT